MFKMNSNALLILLVTFLGSSNDNFQSVQAFAPSKSVRSIFTFSTTTPAHFSHLNSNSEDQDERVIIRSNTAASSLGKQVLSSLLGALVLFTSQTSTIIPEAILPGGVANAEARLVGEIAGSGLVFKDTLNVESFEDPKVKGVTLYISTFQRPLSERLQKGFFSDPSQAAVGCAKTGPVSIADNIAIGKGGEQVFEEKKSLLFKELRVQRIYDVEKNTAVYVTFNTRLDKNSDDNKSRFKSSLCVVNLDDGNAPAAVAPKPANELVQKK